MPKNDKVQSLNSETANSGLNQSPRRNTDTEISEERHKKQSFLGRQRDKFLAVLTGL